MLDTVRNGVLNLAGGAVSQKSRKSSGGTPARSNPLQEALRARGGTKNLDTVISHVSAASDTEASAPRRPRQSMPSRAATTDMASTDDIFDRRPSGQADLGWLDLQAFAPRALQRQLERIAQRAAETIQSDDESESRQRGGFAAGAAAMFAGLPGGDRFASGGGSSGSSSARGPAAAKPAAASSSGLRARLQQRGGVKAEGREPQQEEEEPAVVAEEPELEPSLLTLTAVPEEDEIDGLSPSLAQEDFYLESLELQDANIESTDVSDVPPVSPVEASSEVPSSELSLPAEIPASEPPPAVATETVSSPIAETTPAEQEADEADDSLQPSPAVAPVENAEVATEVEACEGTPAEAAPTPVEEAPQVIHVRSAPDLSTCDDTVPPPARPAPAATSVAAKAATVQAKVIERSHTAPLDGTGPPPARPAPAATSVAAKAAAVQAKVDEQRKSSKEAREVLPPVAKRWPPPKSDILRPPPPSATNGHVKEEEEGNEIVDTAPVEAPAPKPKPKSPDQFKAVHNFWKNNDIKFAGPPMGQKGISQVEAQAALQRLMANSSSVDFNEVRRMRKLIAEKQ